MKDMEWYGVSADGYRAQVTEAADLFDQDKVRVTVGELIGKSPESPNQYWLAELNDGQIDALHIVLGAYREAKRARYAQRHGFTEPLKVDANTPADYKRWWEEEQEISDRLRQALSAVIRSVGMGDLG